MNYYKVIAKCVHAGKRKYIEVAFPICAENACDAARKVLNFRKVKKQLKDAITNVFKIDYEEYLSLIIGNKKDPYLRAHYKREYNISSYDVVDFSTISKKKEPMDRIERVMYKQKKYKLLMEAVKYEFIY